VAALVAQALNGMTSGGREGGRYSPPQPRMDNYWENKMQVHAGALAQRGQSLVEFLVAMAALVPLFMIVNYAARYGDLQQRATQASRYASFQRAMQPDAAKLSDADIKDQMQARFFLAPRYLNDGAIRHDDSVKAIGDDKGQSGFWRDLSGKALLAKPTDVQLTWSDSSLGKGEIANSLDKFAGLLNKDWKGARHAQVELSLFNKLDLHTATPALLKLGASTAVAGDGWGSGGSKSTRDTVAHLVPLAQIPPEITGAVATIFGLFEPHKPEFGCIKPDVVASHRLEGAPNNNQCVK
jgi:hypothetical protein